MNSLAYTEGRFAEIFEAARTSCLTESDTIAYSDSLEKLRETQAGFQYAAEEALKKGEAIGRAEEKRNTAGNLKNLGVPADTIAKATGLSIDEIEKL